MMLGAAASYPAGQNWTNYVRIGAYGLQPNNSDKIVADAEASNVFGIEVDNDIPGRYESFVNPEEKLKAIHDVAEKAHRAGNYAFVYIAGTECITANADATTHTLAKEHPDWLQRKITGEPGRHNGLSARAVTVDGDDRRAPVGGQRRPERQGERLHPDPVPSRGRHHRSAAIGQSAERSWTLPGVPSARAQRTTSSSRVPNRTR